GSGVRVPQRAQNKKPRTAVFCFGPYICYSTHMGFQPEIIFQNKDVLVINKPAGLAVHSDGQKAELTLADWVAGKFPDVMDVGEPMILPDGRVVVRPGIVHRLDKDTSGVMIIALNQKSFLWLKDQFKNRQVEKTYQAILYGKFADTKNEQIIDLPIGRSLKDPRVRVASKKAASNLREAITIFRVLETIGDYSFVEAKPKTGRTHQLRAHFKALQHPIVCDRLYAKDKVCPLGLGRQALHALGLKIVLPDGESKQFEALLAEDIKVALDNLRKPC
ncbi:MAG: Pseudouridine synthase, partial [Patescibacteria group bacterium]|nr:Pseudouridine synthase [Patescibacteria group bacterium]